MMGFGILENKKNSDKKMSLNNSQGSASPSHSAQKKAWINKLSFNKLRVYCIYKTKKVNYIKVASIINLFSFQKPSQV